MKKSPPLLSACIGNFFEHYDTALFSFLSPILAPLLFPRSDPLTGLIYTYAIIPLGMIIRPLGSVFFGLIGDRSGRERALFLSLFGMGIISLLISFIPTFLQVGIFCPLLFFVGRLLQNFCAGGEVAGGAIFILENTVKKRSGFFSGLYGASTVGGALFASFGVFQLASLSLGWRYLYFAGGITAIIGCFFRNFPEKRDTHAYPSLKKVIGENKALLFCIALSAGFSYTSYTMSLVLMNGFIPLITPHSKSLMMKINTYLLLFDFLALPLFGLLGDCVSKHTLMLSASLGTFFLAVPLSYLLNGSIVSIFIVRIVFVTLGIAFSAPFHAWAQEIVPMKYRYTLISFGYAIGSQVFGGPASSLSLYLFKQTGSFSMISLYWAILAGAVSLMLIWIRRKGAESSKHPLLSL